MEAQRQRGALVTLTDLSSVHFLSYHRGCSVLSKCSSRIHLMLKPSIKDVLLRLKLPRPAVPSLFSPFASPPQIGGKKKVFPKRNIPICFSFTIRPRCLMDTRRLHLCCGAARGRRAISRGFPLTGTWACEPASRWKQRSAASLRRS